MVFGWFRSSPPKCPVPAEQQQWIETRMNFLVEKFGLARLQKSEIVLPTTDFFPSSYSATDEEVRHILSLLCQYMGLPADRFELIYFEDDRIAEASAEYEDVWTQKVWGARNDQGTKIQIGLEVSVLDDPLAVTSMLAHELAHVMLLWDKTIALDLEDQDELADLLTVFLGLGSVVSSVTIREANWSTGRYSAWRIEHRTYLTISQFGYAIALFHLSRSEPNPKWLRFLRPDVKHACEEGIKYLRAGNPSEYHHLNRYLD